MTSTADNLARLKKFYVLWNDTKGGCLDALADMLAEPVRVASMDESQPGLAFATDRVTRSEAMRYFAGIFDHWEMVHFTPEEVFADGDRIAMFGRCAYVSKQTGKLAECRIANFWRFEGDKAVEFIDIFDSARAAAAATP